jgi:hypothetical protein
MLLFESKFAKELPAIGIDLGIGIIGFVMSVGWGKSTGRDMNRDTILFLGRLWAGIAIFGIVLTFIM